MESLQYGPPYIGDRIRYVDRGRVEVKSNVSHDRRWASVSSMAPAVDVIHLAGGISPGALQPHLTKWL